MWAGGALLKIIYDRNGKTKHVYVTLLKSFLAYTPVSHPRDVLLSASFLKMLTRIYFDQQMVELNLSLHTLQTRYSLKSVLVGGKRGICKIKPPLTRFCRFLSRKNKNITIMSQLFSLNLFIFVQPLYCCLFVSLMLVISMLAFCNCNTSLWEQTWDYFSNMEIWML